MRTSDVKVGGNYLYKGVSVVVLKRILGRQTNVHLHSGIVPDGFNRTRKRFLLSNGMEVFSDKLEPIIT